MARVLVTVQPLESHVRAIQHVVRALHTLGYEVLVAAPEKVAALVTATYGLPYLKAGQDWTRTPGIGEQLGAALDRDGNEGFIRTIIEHYLTGPTAVAKAHDITTIIHEWRPTAILSDCTDIGSLVAAAQLGIPCISLDNGWTRQISGYRDSVSIGLDRHWPASVTEADVLTPVLHNAITPCPRELAYPDMPTMLEYRVEHPRRVGERLPPWVADIPPDRPLIYASFGSILTWVPRFDEILVPVYARIIAALADVPCTAVLSVGRAKVAELRDDLPEHIRLTPRIDQPLFLQAGVDLILTPAGLGTVKELLTNAIPPLVIPLWSEDFFIAQRFSSLEIGMEAPRDGPAEDLAAAVMQMLTTPAYRHNARRWQRKALALPALESVLTKLLA
jgi:N-glycosyltransferase